jgi:hypothetical protein
MTPGNNPEAFIEDDNHCESLQSRNKKEVRKNNFEILTVGYSVHFFFITSKFLRLKGSSELSI